MFNKEKYINCIGHLISQKFLVIFVYTLIFAAIGAGIGAAFMFGFNTHEFVLIISLVIGIVIGILLGISSIWRIDMKIQEAYWRIDMIAELKNNNSKTEKASRNTENKKD